MSEEDTRTQGFTIFKMGSVRRLSQTHYLIKEQNASGWHLLELKEGNWTCDCGTVSPCPHLYAAQLHRQTIRYQDDPVDEFHVKCRHCGSVDVSRCGFRYNARGIARRYFCNDCRRKFSISHVRSSSDAKPLEIVWLLNEVGMLTSKLTELLTELNVRMDQWSMSEKQITADP